MKMFAGKRALITGSTQGLGLAIARRLASSGCDVVLHGLGDRDAISAAQRQIEAECGVQTFYSPANLQDPSAIESMMHQAQQALGPIDILINNAVTTLRQTQNLERDAAERILLAGKQPTGRLIAPESVAALIASLCTTECRDITGAAIPIDGGWSAM